MDLPPRRAGFSSGLLLVGFVVDKVALELLSDQSSIPVFHSSIIDVES